LFGRSSSYHPAWPMAFRDQLQDAGRSCITTPRSRAGKSCLNAAHQFVEGDVMHWWHPPDSRGMRTVFPTICYGCRWSRASKMFFQSTGDDGLCPSKYVFSLLSTCRPAPRTLLEPAGSGSAARSSSTAVERLIVD